jgi:precorrin-2/cobalt-factor-2 C20-methyltransferase
VSSITAFASAAGLSLSDGFVVSDGAEPNSRILLKVRRPKEIMERLAREGYREFILVERMFMEDMKVYRGPDLPERSDYMSVLYARR